MQKKLQCMTVTVERWLESLVVIDISIAAQMLHCWKISKWCEAVFRFQWLGIVKDSHKIVFEFLREMTGWLVCALCYVYHTCKSFRICRALFSGTGCLVYKVYLRCPIFRSSHQVHPTTPVPVPARTVRTLDHKTAAHDPTVHGRRLAQVNSLENQSDEYTECHGKPGTLDRPNNHASRPSQKLAADEIRFALIKTNENESGIFWRTSKLKCPSSHVIVFKVWNYGTL